MNDVLELTPTTISVYTRHSPDCPKKTDKNWKRCRCRKWLYIFEGGEDRRVSAGTRSWEQAEEVAQAERDRRNPVKQRLQEIKDQEAQKLVLTKAQNITVEDATGRWLRSIKSSSEETAVIYERAARRINTWAADLEIKSLTDVTADMLDQWRGEWGDDADKKYNQIGVTSQSHFQGYLKRFFRYAVRLDLIPRDPALGLAPITKSDKRTKRLTPAQFKELLVAIHMYTESQPGMVREFAPEFKALFLLQRWSGMRILDCLMLPRTALTGNSIDTKTKKTGAKVDCEVPDEVVEALLALSPERERFLPAYFFWNRKASGKEGIEWDTLSTKWGHYIFQMNDHLHFVDDNGKPMRFHSHMLRDTFAVEMLLAGIPLEDVSKLLTHESIKVTEEYYGIWVPDRLKRLKGRAIEAMKQMGATFTA
jgi:integrase/recombinase XerD